MKRILVVLILVLTLALFTACKNGGNDVTPTEEPTNAPTATPEVTVEPTATPVPGPMTYFDSDFSDDTADEAPILDGWNFLDVTNGGNSKVQAEGDNNYFVISGFINMTFSELIEKGYTFSFDAKGIHANDVAAAFVRGNSQLTIPVSTNPNGANYYEADDSGTKFTSTTGIGLWFKADNSLTLFVKTNDSTQKAGIGNIFAELPCSYDSTKWNKIRIVDDNKGKIEYYVNEEKIATVEYSDLTEYEVFEGEKFYQNVSIKDKDGNVLASTENAFVYEYSEIAFGMRAAQLSVDNILIKDNE